MQQFLASDVIYPTALHAALDAALEEEELDGETGARAAASCPTSTGSSPTSVADRVGAARRQPAATTRAAPGPARQRPRPVTLGGQALNPGGAGDRPLGDDLAFDVQVTNQGENTETDVTVTVTIGSGGDAIELDEGAGHDRRGRDEDRAIPLAEQPPSGQNVPITVEVEPVPGEEKTDNNKGDVPRDLHAVAR